MPDLDPTVFVNDVFEAVAYRSYLPGAPPPPSKPAAPAAVASLPPSGLPYDDVPMTQASQTMGAPSSQKESRKRGYHDRGGEFEGQGGKEGRQGGRASKQPRRGGRGGRADDMNGVRGSATSAAFPGTGSQMPLFPGAPSGHFDANAAMEALFGMGALAMAGNHFQPQQPVGKRRARCRDYDTKGYCARGQACMFEHGDDPMFLPPTLGSFGPQTGPHDQATEGMLTILGSRHLKRLWANFTTRV